MRRALAVLVAVLALCTAQEAPSPEPSQPGNPSAEAVPDAVPQADPLDPEQAVDPNAQQPAEAATADAAPNLDAPPKLSEQLENKPHDVPAALTYVLQRIAAGQNADDENFQQIEAACREKEAPYAAKVEAEQGSLTSIVGDLREASSIRDSAKHELGSESFKQELAQARAEEGRMETIVAEMKRIHSAATTHHEAFSDDVNASMTVLHPFAEDFAYLLDKHVKQIPDRENPAQRHIEPSAAREAVAEPKFEATAKADFGGAYDAGADYSGLRAYIEGAVPGIETGSVAFGPGRPTIPLAPAPDAGASPVEGASDAGAGAVEGASDAIEGAGAAIGEAMPSTEMTVQEAAVEDAERAEVAREEAAEAAANGGDSTARFRGRRGEPQALEPSSASDPTLDSPRTVVATFRVRLAASTDGSAPSAAEAAAIVAEDFATAGSPPSNFARAAVEVTEIVDYVGAAESLVPDPEPDWATGAATGPATTGPAAATLRFARISSAAGLQGHVWVLANFGGEFKAGTDYAGMLDDWITGSAPNASGPVEWGAALDLGWSTGGRTVVAGFDLAVPRETGDAAVVGGLEDRLYSSALPDRASSSGLQLPVVEISFDKAECTEGGMECSNNRNGMTACIEGRCTSSGAPSPGAFDAGPTAEDDDSELPPMSETDRAFYEKLPEEQKPPFVAEIRLAQANQGLMQVLQSIQAKRQEPRSAEETYARDLAVAEADHERARARLGQLQSKQQTLESTGQSAAESAERLAQEKAAAQARLLDHQRALAEKTATCMMYEHEYVTRKRQREQVKDAVKRVSWSAQGAAASILTEKTRVLKDNLECCPCHASCKAGKPLCPFCMDVAPEDHPTTDASVSVAGQSEAPAAAPGEGQDPVVVGAEGGA
jgi:hypothetical protein